MLRTPEPNLVAEMSGLVPSDNSMGLEGVSQWVSQQFLTMDVCFGPPKRTSWLECGGYRMFTLDALALDISSGVTSPRIMVLPYTCRLFEIPPIDRLTAFCDDCRNPSTERQISLTFYNGPEP